MHDIEYPQRSMAGMCGPRAEEDQCCGLSIDQ